MHDLYDDARSYLSRNFGGMDMSDVPPDAVIKCIDGIYEGGWDAYKASYEHFMATTAQRVSAAPPTPLQMFAKMRAKVAGSPQVFRLKVHEEIVSVDISDDICTAVIRTAQVEERRSRDRITAIGLKKITVRKVTVKIGDRDVTGWSKPEVETVSIPMSADVLTWGRAWTADRVADDNWQAETCYRPGTDTHPMDGPIRKLEISHEQAFEGEAFQNPTTPA